MKFARYEGYKDSGVEWLGKIPSHWDLKRIKSVFSVSKEKNGIQIVGEMLSVSGYRGIEVKEYDDENRKRHDDDLAEYRVVRRGQLVVNTMWLNYSGLGISKFEGYVSPAYRSYNVSSEIESWYAHHLMRSSVYVMAYTKFMQGVRPNSLQIKTDDFDVFPVLLPPLLEQRQIAAFLERETGRIDALIAMQTRLLELLGEKRGAVIARAVTRGLDAGAEFKDSGVEWLGEIPEGWKLSQVKSVFTCFGGGTPTKDKLEYWNGDIPWVSPKDMKDKVINTAEDSITTLGLESSSSKLVPENSVLMVVRSGIFSNAQSLSR